MNGGAFDSRRQHERQEQKPDGGAPQQATHQRSQGGLFVPGLQGGQTAQPRAIISTNRP